MQFPDRVTDPATGGTTLTADKPDEKFVCQKCKREFKSAHGLMVHDSRIHPTAKERAFREKRAQERRVPDHVEPPLMRTAEPRDHRANDRLRVTRHAFVSAVVDPGVTNTELDKTLLMLDSLAGLIETLRSR